MQGIVLSNSSHAETILLVVEIEVDLMVVHAAATKTSK